MKKKLVFLSAVTLLGTLGLTGCDSKPLNFNFAQTTYEIKSGDCVTVIKGNSDVTYELIGGDVQGVSVDPKTGRITFDNTINNYSQVVYGARVGDSISAEAVVTLIWDYTTPVISWVGDLQSISDGSYILAKTDNGLSVSFELVEPSLGVSINAMDGRVSISSSAKEGQTFKVKVSSMGVELVKEFKVAKENLAKSLTASQCAESEHPTLAVYELDFSEVPNGYEEEVLGINIGNKILDNNIYSYDKSTHLLTLKAEFYDSFTTGESNFGIITPRNTINVSIVKATKFIKNVEDLVSINDDAESLKGYYVLANDIDVYNYCSSKVWLPIGLYHDTTDATATADAFVGTFDGNGHVIKNLYLSRTDEFSFNAGLFGYCGSSSYIKNLGLEMSDTMSQVSSYSGGFCGVNNGIIENCWAKVNLTPRDKVHRCIGGFMGRNFNTVKHCYVYGYVSSNGTDVGRFAGQNGEVGVTGVFKDCHAYTSDATNFAGAGELTENECFNYDSLADLKAAEFSNFEDRNWKKVNNELPTLNVLVTFNVPFSLTFTNKNTIFTKGSSIYLRYQILPAELADKYQSKVVYSCNTDKLKIDSDGEVEISSDCPRDVTFKITLEDTGVYLEDTFSISVYDKLETLEIVNDLPTHVESGKRYKLNHKITPENAYDNYVWSTIPKSMPGVKIEGDIMTITDAIDAQGRSNFDLVCTIGSKSDSITLNINKSVSLDNVIIINDGSVQNAEIIMPNGKDLTNAKVYRYSKLCSSAFADGGSIKIPLSELTVLTNTYIPFTVRLEDGSIYKVKIICAYKNPCDPSRVPQDAIHLTSVNDFKQYFNIVDYDSTRYLNYDKNFVIDNDIDFEGLEIKSIGDSDHPFKGHIYGLEHKLSNIEVKDSEEYWTLSATDKENKYRSSKYSVGFFGAFSGSIEDVTFENLNVNANNYVGTFAGKLVSNPTLRSLIFVNCSVKNVYGKDYDSDGDGHAGKISCSGSAIYDYVIYNGDLIVE